MADEKKTEGKDAAPVTTKLDLTTAHELLIKDGYLKECEAKEPQTEEGKCVFVADKTGTAIIVKNKKGDTDVKESNSFKVTDDASVDVQKKFLTNVYSYCRLFTSQTQLLKDKCIVKLGIKVLADGIDAKMAETLKKTLEDVSGGTDIQIGAEFALSKLLAEADFVKNVKKASGDDTKVFACNVGDYHHVSTTPAIKYYCMTKADCITGEPKGIVVVKDVPSYTTDTATTQKENVVCLNPKTPPTTTGNKLSVSYDKLFADVTTKAISPAASASFAPMLCVLVCFLVLLLQRYI